MSGRRRLALSSGLAAVLVAATAVGIVVLRDEGSTNQDAEAEAAQILADSRQARVQAASAGQVLHTKQELEMASPGTSGGLVMERTVSESWEILDSDGNVAQRYSRTTDDEGNILDEGWANFVDHGICIQMVHTTGQVSVVEPCELLTPEPPQMGTLWEETPRVVATRMEGGRSIRVLEWRREFPEYRSPFRPYLELGLDTRAIVARSEFLEGEMEPLVSSGYVVEENGKETLVFRSRTTLVESVDLSAAPPMAFEMPAIPPGAMRITPPGPARTGSLEEFQETGEFPVRVPTYVPQGAELRPESIGYGPGREQFSFEYVGPDGHLLQIIETASTTPGGIRPPSSAEDVTVRAYQGFIQELPLQERAGLPMLVLVWQEEDMNFQVLGTFSRDELLRVANSLAGD